MKLASALIKCNANSLLVSCSTMHTTTHLQALQTGAAVSAVIDKDIVLYTTNSIVPLT